jgi:magnesium transporter
MPLALLAGIYGMNFEYMPELKLHFGNPLIFGFMVTIAGGVFAFFYHRGWIE